MTIQIIYLTELNSAPIKSKSINADAPNVDVPQETPNTFNAVVVLAIVVVLEVDAPPIMVKVEVNVEAAVRIILIEHQTLSVPAPATVFACATLSK